MTIQNTKGREHGMHGGEFVYPGLIQLLIGTCINLNAFPEPLLLHHLHPGGGVGDVGRVHFIVRHNKMSHSRLSPLSVYSTYMYMYIIHTTVKRTGPMLVSRRNTQPFFTNG